MLPKYTYLYGFTAEQIKALADMPYKQALQLKIQAAKDLNQRLLVPNFMDRDTTRVNEVAKAIKFNQTLLEELGI